MKALVYRSNSELDTFSINLETVSEPIIKETDVLVNVNAFGINPGDTYFRKTLNVPGSGYRILGYDFAGTIIKKGSLVKNFDLGERVYGIGDIATQGAYAELIAVDSLLIAKMPDMAHFEHLAGVPIATLTAWNSLFRNNNQLPDDVKNVLVLGAAGGVGTMAVQLLKARTEVQVIATASRQESEEWLESFAPDIILNHKNDIPKQLRENQIDHVDFIFAVNGLADAMQWIPSVIRPYGHLAIIEIETGVNLWPLMNKSISIHLENVFSKNLFNYKKETQGDILAQLISLIIQKKIKSPVSTILHGLSRENIFNAHKLLEGKTTVGKIVIQN